MHIRVLYYAKFYSCFKDFPNIFASAFFPYQSTTVIFERQNGNRTRIGSNSIITSQPNDFKWKIKGKIRGKQVVPRFI